MLSTSDRGTTGLIAAVLLLLPSGCGDSNAKNQPADLYDEGCGNLVACARDTVGVGFVGLPAGRGMVVCAARNCTFGRSISKKRTGLIVGISKDARRARVVVVRAGVINADGRTGLWSNRMKVKLVRTCPDCWNGGARATLSGGRLTLSSLRP